MTYVRPPSSSVDLLLQTDPNMTAAPTTIAPPLTPSNDTTPGGTSCDGIQYDYEIPTAIVCGVCFVFGIVFTFFGYRCFRAIMFLVGFLLSSVVIFLVCSEQSSLPTGANVGIALGVGVACGLATMLFKLFGLFVTGFEMGVCLSGGLVLVILEQFYHADVVWVPLGVTFAVGTACGLLTVKWQRPLVILSTAVTGAAVLVVCADYFVEMFRQAGYVYDRFRVSASPEPCWYGWLLLGTWPLVALVGVLVQQKVTSRGYSHKDTKKEEKLPQHVELRKLHSKRASSRRKQPKDGNAVRLEKYQNLYRVRRCNGDIVAVSYLQSIQTHLSPELQRIASTTHLPAEPIILPSDDGPFPEMTTTLLSNASTTITTLGPVTHIDDADIADV